MIYLPVDCADFGVQPFFPQPLQTNDAVAVAVAAAAGWLAVRDFRFNNSFFAFSFRR